MAATGNLAVGTKRFVVASKRFVVVFFAVFSCRKII